MWAIAYIHGSLFTGFWTTSQCEALHALITMFVGSRYNLTELCQHDQHFMNCICYEAMGADFTSWYGNHTP